MDKGIGRKSFVGVGSTEETRPKNSTISLPLFYQYHVENPERLRPSSANTQGYGLDRKGA